MLVQPIKTDIFQEGENLLAFLFRYFKKIPEKSVVVVTSKIVALAESRTVTIEDESKREAVKEKYIRQESQMAMATKYVWLTVKDDMVMASAGIDESNAQGKLILLPKDSFKAASEIRKQLQKKYGVKQLGVLITDSRTVPLRAGVTGVALGYAGFKGIKDYRGKPDIFGRKFHFSRTNIADGLATTAVLVMGEGDERYPLALITDSPTEFSERVDRSELRIDIQDDMYQPLFSSLQKTEKPAVKKPRVRSTRK